MLKTSHLQEFKRRYASMYTPKEETLDEHCGVCDEQGIEEAIDYKYDGKVVKISKKNFSKVHKDFKNSTKGKERMMINDPKTGGSISVPVQFEEVEIKEAFFKVKIPDVAPTFVEASSEGAVKASMRKVLKPDVVADLEIERVTPAAMKKMYRDMAQGKDDVGESVDESQELQAIMALDDAGIKASINRKDQVVVKKKDLKKAKKALEKSFKKGGEPKLVGEEVMSAYDKVKAIRNRLNESSDEHAETELKLYIENDRDLYRQQIVPIIKNVQRRMKKGTYDHIKAPKLWMYLVDNGAKKYVKEFGGDVRSQFPKDVRQSVAVQFANEYRAEIEIQGGEMV